MAKKRTSRQSGSQLTPILAIVGGLILVAVAFWLALRPSSAELAEQDQPAQVRGPYPEVERVSIADTKAGFDDGSALIVDVRSEQVYLEAHIPGAILIPSSEITARYQELPKDKLLYLYCT